jgi:hypothetical protein
MNLASSYREAMAAHAARQIPGRIGVA